MFRFLIVATPLLCHLAWALTENVAEDGFSCPEDWGYFADPENCIKYYRCEFGSASSNVCRKG